MSFYTHGAENKNKLNKVFLYIDIKSVIFVRWNDEVKHYYGIARSEYKYWKQNGMPGCQLGPRYEEQLTRMAEPIHPSGQSSSYSLTTLSSSSSTDRRAETDRKVITTRIAVAHHFICRLRRRESCILGATSSQPTLPLHELPPARLVIHRQTSNHERRKGTLIVQSRSGILADFCPRQH